MNKSTLPNPKTTFAITKDDLNKNDVFWRRGGEDR